MIQQVLRCSLPEVNTLLDQRELACGAHVGPGGLSFDTEYITV